MQLYTAIGMASFSVHFGRENSFTHLMKYQTVCTFLTGAGVADGLYTMPGVVDGTGLGGAMS
jgi:hypothetical protein